jgi:hypothetical protein
MKKMVRVVHQSLPHEAMQSPKRDHGSVTWKKQKVQDLQANARSQKAL